MINEPLVPNAVFVAWRDPQEHRCYPVGRLARVPRSDADTVGDDAEFEFAYVQGANEARSAGFKHIVSFEDINRVYRSRDLFPFFENRIMAKSRPEWLDYLGRLSLDQPDPLELLSRTGGIRTTDTYEIFPFPRFDPGVFGFRTSFLVHALRHFPKSAHERITRLLPSESLYLVLDCQNEYDPHAIALRTGDRVLVGHIPSYLLLDVYTLTNQCAIVEVRVAKVNMPPAPLDQRLLCEMESCWPDDYKPFVSPQFQPIAEDAIPSQQLIGDQLGGIPFSAP